MNGLIARATAAVLLAAAPGMAVAQDARQHEVAADAAADPASGLKLPAGFTATVYHDGVGPARHIAVSPDGDVYVKLRKVGAGGGIVALRDEDGDGKSDIVESFGTFGGTPIAFHDGALYAGSDTEIYRFPMKKGELKPTGEAEVIVAKFPEQKSHSAKAIAFDDTGNLYVAIGSPSNACQDPDRSKHVKGKQPCDELEKGAGVWRFSADETGQSFSLDKRYATGMRHIVAMDWNGDSNGLFAAVHGRDQLNSLWPEHFTAEQNAELPGEEFVAISEGDDFGWPYSYYDPERKARMVAPEYGGDGSQQAETGKYKDPVFAFPAHWAPNGMTFYTGDQFPEYFKDGAFVAFHGSWNRAPLPQGGYMVTFVPFEDGQPTGEWQVFADGFKGGQTLMKSGEADHRPIGLAEGPDGSLYIADSVKGRIWKITYEDTASDKASAQ